MDDGLAKRGQSLEEMFFKERDAQLIAQRKKLEQMEQNKNALAQASGIQNPKVLDKLVELEITPGTLASLVVFPLVEVAWADGQLDEKEKQAILAQSAKGSLAKESLDHNLLKTWINERPSPKMMEAWTQYIAGLCEILPPQELNALKTELLNRAQKVAEASGGFLSKISAEEKQVLKKLDDVFKKSGAH